MEKSGKGVGASLRRKEDRRHLHGAGQFVGDISLPGMLDAAFVRSPVAHGRIKSIDAPKHVFTARDFPDLKPIVAVTQIEGFKASDHPPLATERVRFAGEPVAVAVAATRAQAEDLAESVVVDIGELPAVVDMLDALKPGTPLVREEWGDNVFVRRENLYSDLEAAKKAAAGARTREDPKKRQSAGPPGGGAVPAAGGDR